MRLKNKCLGLQETNSKYMIKKSQLVGHRILLKKLIKQYKEK